MVRKTVEIVVLKTAFIVALSMAFNEHRTAAKHTRIIPAS